MAILNPKSENLLAFGQVQKKKLLQLVDRGRGPGLVKG